MTDIRTLAGLHSVRSALRHAPERILELWVDAARHDQRLQEILRLARAAGVSAQPVARKTLDKLAGDARHQGVVARRRGGGAHDERFLDDLLANLDAAPFLLILDGVQDPHNLGACLRSADAVGVHAVIAPKDRSVGLTHAASKVASGAAEYVPFVRVTNLARTLRRLRDEQGVWLVGASGDADKSLYQLDLKGPLGIVMGAEGEGMRRLTAEACDFLASLPMRGSVESLNVSVATGVCLYEALRQREVGLGPV